jgi:non-specific serine/threonine protein kinase
LVVALQWYWRVRWLLGEGRGWTEAVLALPAAAAPSAPRMQALNSAARLANLQADYRAARALALECAAIARMLGDRATLAHALDRQAYAAMGEGDVTAARALWEESVALFRSVDDRPGLAIVLIHLGIAVQREGDLTRAMALQRESAALAQAIGERSTLAVALMDLANVARLQGNPEEAGARLKEALTVAAELGYPYQVLGPLEALAVVAARTGDATRAARLFGAVEALRSSSATPTGMTINRGLTITADLLAEARAALGEPAFAAAWAEGRAMTLEQAVAAALAVTVAAIHPAPSDEAGGAALSSDVAAPPAGLSRREAEVLVLIAGGLSNQEIADRLVLSINTVERHVSHILTKLGATNRTEAAAYAHRARLTA